MKLYVCCVGLRTWHCFVDVAVLGSIVHCHNLKYCGISLTTLSRVKVIASLMGASMWQRCTPVPVPHSLACEQTQAYTSDVSKARIATIFRTSYSVSCDSPATRTAAGLLFDIDAIAGS